MKSLKWLTCSRKSAFLQELPIYLKRLYSSQNVLASLQHPMAGSTRWLLTAVNMYICVLVWVPSAPLPAAILSPRSPGGSAVAVLACSAPWRAEGHSPPGRFLPETWVSRGGSWRHCRDGARRDGCASAVTQPLLTQESPRIFTSPLHQVATCHAALLVIWF